MPRPHKRYDRPRIGNASPSWAAVVALVVAAAATPSVAQSPGPGSIRSGLLAPFRHTNPPRAERASGSPTAPPALVDKRTVPPTNPVTLGGPLRWTNPPEVKQTQATTPAPTTVQTQATAPAPTTAGPVNELRLWGPFYWQNQPSERRQQASMFRPPPALNHYGQSVNLLGPLRWTNVPAETPNDEQPAEQPSGSATRLPAPVPAIASNPFALMQAEELAAPPGFRAGAEAVPIPSVTSPTPPAAGGQSLADAESLGEEPEETRLQFLRADTVLLEPGEMQVDVGVTYQLIEDQFTLVETGTTNLVEANLKQRLLVVPIEFRYGFTRRMQGFIGTTVGWSHTDLTTPTSDADDSYGGIGDATAGLSFLLFDGGGVSTDTVLTVAGTFPTGDDPLTGDPLAVTAPTLGDGFFAVSVDVLFINTYDPVVVFYGLGFRESFETEIGGVNIRPGTEFRGQLGMGFAVNKNVTLSTRFNASFITRTEVNGISIPNSMLEPFSIELAATVLKGRRLVEPFVNFGVSDDAPASRFGVTWTF